MIKDVHSISHIAAFLPLPLTDKSSVESKASVEHSSSLDL